VDAGGDGDAGGPCSGSPCPTLLWAKGFGSNTADYPSRVAVDPGGDVLIVDTVQGGTVDFGGGPLGPGIAIARLDANGAHKWSKIASAYNVTDVAIDAGGNLLLTGMVLGTANLGCGPLTSAGSYDVWVAKLAPDGTCLWSKNWGGSGWEQPVGVAVDAAGDVYVTGTFEASFKVGPSTLTSAGLQDVFVAKLDPSGNPLWAQGFGTANLDFVTYLAVDPAGDVVLTGRFASSIGFGGAPLVSSGGFDVYLAKLGPNGAPLWSKRFGDASDQWGESVAFDATGNLIVSAMFQGTIDMGGGPLASAGGWDIVIAELDASGNHVWSERFGGAGDESPEGPKGLAVAPSGHLFVAGTYTGTPSFGGPPFPTTGDPNNDVFFLELDASGAPVWSQGYAANLEQDALAVGVDATGHLIAAGIYESPAPFDLGQGPLPAFGTFDLFVARFTP
jgi:hypothetical protein